MWQLHNENYHQMVSILVNVVKNFSPLRIEAPEWYPREYRVKEGVESLGCNDTRDKNGVKTKSVKEDEWRKPNKVVRVLPMERKKAEYKNKHDVLSDEENEELDENDDNTCANSHSMDDDEKHEAMHNELKYVKGVLEMKEEELEVKDEKVISMENENVEYRNQIKKLVDEMRELKDSIHYLEDKNEKHEKMIDDRNKEVRMLKVKCDIQENENERLLLVNTMCDVNVVLNAIEKKYLSEELEHSCASKHSDEVISVPDEMGKQSEEMEAYRKEMLSNLDVAMHKLWEMNNYLNDESRESHNVKCQHQNLGAMRLMVENASDIDAIRVIDMGFKWRMKKFGKWSYFRKKDVSDDERNAWKFFESYAIPEGN